MKALPIVSIAVLFEGRMAVLESGQPKTVAAH